MRRGAPSHPEARVAIVRWAARIGAVTAEALARYEGATVASARARLQAAERAGLLAGVRPLADGPPLFTATSTGLRVAGVSGFEALRVSPANARHLEACADAAATLARAFPGHVVSGERELRHDERAFGRPLASATVRGPGGAFGGNASQLHRPDLVLWPRERGRLPVAVEVELTVKAPRRLAAICTAWARCRCVDGVVYLTSPEAQVAVARAIERARASAGIVLLPLGVLTDEKVEALERPVAGGA